MLLSLLIYAYSAGVLSSRQIERLCRTDVAMRVICGLQVPDHTVIARFRQRHQDSVRDLFTQVLLICAKAGLGRLGAIAVDGTKIAADAAKKATCRRQWLQQQVDEILARPATQDAAEDITFGSGEQAEETPRRLRGRRDREERIQRALAEVIAEEAERGWDAEAAAAKERAFLEATRAGRNDVGSRPVGADPVAIAEARLVAARDRLAEEVAAKREQIAVIRERIRRFEAGQGPKPNLRPFSFDENRGQQVARAKRWVARAERELAAARAHKDSPPAEREQADLLPVPGGGRHGPRGITTKDGRPVARRNVTDPTLDGCCVAASAAGQSSGHPRGCDGTHCPYLAGWIGTLLFDAGYWTHDNLTAPGPDRPIAPGKNAALPQPGQHPGPPPQEADPATLMIHRLATDAGVALYKRRSATVEPVNGHLKDRTALRRFARRGLAACQAELTFATMVLNLGKLCRLPKPRRSAALTA